MVLADPLVIRCWSPSARCVVMLGIELLQVLMEAPDVFQQLVIGEVTEGNHRVRCALGERVGLAGTWGRRSRERTRDRLLLVRY